MGPITDPSTARDEGLVAAAPRRRTSGRFDALPFVANLAGGQAPGIRRFAESVLGWQAVDDRTASLVPPQLILADVAGAVSETSLPVLLLVSDDDDPGAAAAAAVGAAAVLSWPRDRDRLGDAGALLAGGVAHDDGHRSREIRVGGACGGVGTTTVSLALGGIAAWRRHRALVLTHGAVPAPGGRAVEPDDLVGARVWEAAAQAPGLIGLRVLRLVSPVPDAPVDGGPADLVVRDLGVDEDVDVLVVRRDRAGLEAVSRSGAAVVVVTDVGPVARRGMAAALQGRRLVVLPWSTRVARAGAVGAVPARLPGAWLRRLSTVLGGRT